ncbi:unnamed protein product, partial [Mesorhabditis belari]|uniref:Uncharacterized protein n=1 Tax=Mesorhabditis belari TaxID=2138241 RepID=A0AAF3F8F5_9BILA
MDFRKSRLLVVIHFWLTILKPSSIDVNTYYFVCRYKFENTKELRIESLNGTATNWGVSFRVGEWVDAEKRLLVIPINEPTTSINIFVAIDIIVTFVASSHLFESDNALIPINYSGEDEDMSWFCSDFQPVITCRMDALFSVFQGSDPGHNGNELYSLSDKK